MKQKQCQHIKTDSTRCSSFAMNGSDFCYRHNPDISEDEKLNASSKGGSCSPSTSQMPACRTESGRERGLGGEVNEVLPPMPIENFQDIVAVMADSINQVRAGKISQKTGSTIAYMSFIMLMAMDKAKAEAKQQQIDKLKAEGKWRPEPKYSPKFYTYKDDFFLDKDGNHLVVEKDGSTFRPEMKFKYEDNVSPLYSKGGNPDLSGRGVKHNKHKRRKIKRIKLKPLTREQHEKLMDDPDYNNVPFSNPDDDYIQKSVEFLNKLKE